MRLQIASVGIVLLLGGFLESGASSRVTGRQDGDGPAVRISGTPARDRFGDTLELLGQGRTVEARTELNRLLDQNDSDPEIHYQLARSFMIDAFEAGGRESIQYALRELDAALANDPDHLNSLKLKWEIHAIPSFLHYHPELSHKLAEEIGHVGLSDRGFIIEMARELIHAPYNSDRLARAAALLEKVLDYSRPHSAEEGSALLLMGKARGFQGEYRSAIDSLTARLKRPMDASERSETLRELGANYYFAGQYGDAADVFVTAFQQDWNPTDQFLFKLCLEELRHTPSQLPRELLFPLREERVDPDAALLEFADIAPKKGLDRSDGNGTVAWGDYDMDGDLDLALAGSNTLIALYRNTGGQFTDVTAEAGLSEVPSGYSLNFVDYDNDGFLDLYVSGNAWHGPRRNQLFHNMGDGTFQDVSRTAGVDDPGTGFVSLWGDLDNDGFPDLVVANGVLKDGSTPQIYRNHGDGTFTNVTRQAGLDEPPAWGTIGIALGDYDRDGDLDLFINGWYPAPNRLYRNDGDFTFTEVAEQSGVLQPPHKGFVAFFFDYNHDGHPDILTTSLADFDAVVQGLHKDYVVRTPEQVHPDAPRLFRNNGDRTFTDVTLEAGLAYPVGIMGAGVGDVDNDGDIDLYFGTGDPTLWRFEPNRFFRNNGDGSFSDLTMTTGLKHVGKGHGITFIDIDDDGDLDIYHQLGGAYPGDWWPNAFYENRKGNQNNWLQIDLTGTSSNRFAIGTAVVVKAGPLLVYREVKGSEGFGSTDPYRLHFGLNQQKHVDSVEVWWPSGKKQIFQEIDANQRIEIAESSDAWQSIK